MSVQIIKKTLQNKYFTFNAMAFIPDQAEDAPQIKDHWSLCTHGYTSCKKDALPWAQRLSQAGVPCAIFDLPGHYLGSYAEVESFEDFKLHVHECFVDAFEFLKSVMGQHSCRSLSLIGHSLGALCAVKALELDAFSNLELQAIAVGFGIGQHKTTHLFETAFYQKTLDIRKQLVSPAISSEVVFPWIHQEKLDMKVQNRSIHLITGLDDVVVGEGGMDALAFELSTNNQVTSFAPAKLPHHEPGLAATHIYSFLKKKFNW